MVGTFYVASNTMTSLAEFGLRPGLPTGFVDKSRCPLAEKPDRAKGIDGYHKWWDFQSDAIWAKI